MDAATLILIAPCSLLAGRSAADSGGAALSPPGPREFWPFSPACRPSSPSSASRPLVRSGAGHRPEAVAVGWASRLVLHVDALSVLFAFMGACIGGLVLLYSIGYMAHDKSATRFYATMLVFIGGFIGLVYQRQPLHLLSLLGTGRPLLVLAGGLLVHQPRSRQRRAQSSADDPHRRLRTAGRHPDSLSPHRQRPVDRSRRRAQLHRRHLCC